MRLAAILEAGRRDFLEAAGEASAEQAASDLTPEAGPFWNAPPEMVSPSAS